MDGRYTTNDPMFPGEADTEVVIHSPSYSMVRNTWRIYWPRLVTALSILFVCGLLLAELFDLGPDRMFGTFLFAFEFTAKVSASCGAIFGLLILVQLRKDRLVPHR